jgi:hypothetical protein
MVLEHFISFSLSLSLSLPLNYNCEVAKLGTAATGNFLSGKRERDGE